MTAYLWLAVIGLITFGVGAFGHLYSTRVQVKEVRRETHITYFDAKKGWMRTWIDSSPDVKEFWEAHQIVERKKE